MVELLVVTNYGIRELTAMYWDPRSGCSVFVKITNYGIRELAVIC